jgi:hypothetical protein
MPQRLDTPTPSVPRSQLSLMSIGPWWRIGAVLLGLACLGSGGAAVFVTDSQAGQIALLAESLIFLLIGCGGRLPIKVKFGNYEAAFPIEPVEDEARTESTPKLVNSPNFEPFTPGASAAHRETECSFDRGRNDEPADCSFSAHIEASRCGTS